MFKRLALLLWLIPAALAAQTDLSVRAAAVAGSVMGIGDHSLKTTHTQDSIIPAGNPEYPGTFIVTFKPSGFVIVSAGKGGPSVLGYSLTTGFPSDPSHPLRSWLLPSYVTMTARTGNLKSEQTLKYSTDHIVLPLISAQWGQGDPWNRYCPADSTGKRALVGCVAVAMSQIMEKWQWPEIGSGEVSYVPMQHAEYGEIRVNFDTTHYHWNQTHDIYPTDAASLVLFHSGAAALMNYDPALSSTSVDRFAVPALIRNFSYNQGMIFREKEGNDSGEWIRMLHQELDNNRPVLYAGTSPDGKSSHAFNIDGYRNDTYFHINWGWNGAGDGWYRLDGMAGGGADFSAQQGAIFGIQPAGIPLHDRPSSLDILAGDNFIRLFWERPVISAFSHFNIYRDGVRIGQTAETGYLDLETVNGRSYSYTVTASYEGDYPGESAPTPVLTAIPWERMRPGYLEDFERGSRGWQLQDSVRGFRIGPASDLQVGGNTGILAAIRSEGHPAGEQVADYLTSPVVYPGNFPHLAISFDYMFRQNPGIDTLVLLWRNFTTGHWELLARLDSTGGYSDWKTLHFYLPEVAANTPIQVAFYYNDSFGQGYGAAIDNFAVYTVAEKSIPAFSVDYTDICQGQNAIFTDLSTGPARTWEWDFGDGAEPRFAYSAGPHQVTYSTGGKKTVKLSVNHLDHLCMPEAMTIREKPVAAFEYTRKFQEIIFADKSSHADQLLWIFGDGTTSSMSNPAHTYYTKSLFEVKQVAYNGTCDPDTLTIFIDMRNGTGIDDRELLQGLSIFPNPTLGKVTLLWNNFFENPLKIRILSVTGQEFYLQEFSPRKELTLDLSDFPEGIYILQVAYGKVIRNEQIIKVNN